MHPILTAAEQRVATAFGAGADKGAILQTGPLRSSVDIAVTTTGPATLVVEQRDVKTPSNDPTAVWDQSLYDAGTYAGESTPPIREVDRVSYGSATEAFEQYDITGGVVRAYLDQNHEEVEVVARGV
jgi:hypothetical protein